MAESVDECFYEKVIKVKGPTWRLAPYTPQRQSARGAPWAGYVARPMILLGWKALHRASRVRSFQKDLILEWQMRKGGFHPLIPYHPMSALRAELAAELARNPYLAKRSEQ